MKITYYFYVLKNKKTKEIRYFGKTLDLKRRLQQHICESRKGCITHKCNWIKSIDYKVEIESIYTEQCSVEESVQVEKTLLRKLMKRYNLTNSWDNCVGVYKTGRLVYQYDLDGNFLRTFENSNHASIITNIPDSNILRACKKANEKGAIKAGNYYWLFQKYDKYPFELKINKGEKLIIQKDLQNNFIKEFASAREASKELNIGYRLISQVCNKYKKQTHGYKFQFKEER